MTDNTYTKSNGEQILMGQDINGIWCVSCWDELLNNRWELRFKSEEEAKVEFERWRD